MRFTLVEPLFSYQLIDRPNLGCAMLIATCREKGHEVSLVRGQSYYLEQVFTKYPDEIWTLLRSLSPAEIESFTEKTFILELRKLTLAKFRAKLLDVFDKVLVERSPRTYLGSPEINEMVNLNQTIVDVYEHFIKKGSTLKIVDDYFNVIMSSKPEAIGFSISGTFSKDGYNNFDLLSKALRRRIKAERPDLPLIIGGSSTAYYEETGIESLFTEQCFDYLVKGAGDLALPRLLDHLGAKTPPHEIPNLFWLNGDQLVGNKVEVVTGIDQLPIPDFSDYDLSRFFSSQPVLPILTARGCSYRKCTFCSHYLIDQNTYRQYSYQKTLDTIKSHKAKYDCHYFVLHDEELPPGRAKNLSQALIEGGIADTYFYTYARFASSYNNENLVRLMREAGFRVMHWGLESASKPVLDLMKKGTDPKSSGEILKKFHENGIMNMCFVLIGFPGETREHATETIEFLKTHSEQIQSVGWSHFRLQKNTPVWENKEAYGIQVHPDESYTFTRGMTPEESEKFLSDTIIQQQLGYIDLTARPYRFVQHLDDFLRNQLVQVAAMEPLSAQAVSHMIANENFENCYPMVFGTLDHAKSVFQPVKTHESSHSNMLFPEPEVITDPILAMFVRLADGGNSVAEIVQRITDEGLHPTPSSVRTAARRFLKLALNSGWALFFAKSWRPKSLAAQPLHPETITQSL